MRSGPHINIRRAAMRHAGRGLDIPALHQQDENPRIPIRHRFDANQNSELWKPLQAKNLDRERGKTTTIHKQFIRSTAEYCSASWTPNFSDKTCNTLQIHQNNALRTATGWYQNNSHRLHTSRNQKLKIRDYMDLKGAHFYDRIKTETSHPLHQFTETSETPHPYTTRAS